MRWPCGAACAGPSERALPDAALTGPARPGHAAQPDRLDVAPDEPRPRRRADRRLPGLPGGARPRRGGGDLHRGHGGARDRSADRALDRRLRPRRRPGLPAPRRRAAVARRAGCSCSCSTAGASASPRRRDLRRSRRLPCRRRGSTSSRARSRSATSPTCRGLRRLRRKAREGGVDGLEVSMSHGYLGAQFFSPMTNLRDDEYDLEHGLRFAREVLRPSARGPATGVAVGVRLAADEGPTGALGPAACARIARGLCGDGLVDFVDLALGYSPTLMGSVGIVPPPPVERNAIAEPAGAVRAALPGVPMIATTRVVEPRRRRAAARRRPGRRGRHDAGDDRRPRPDREGRGRAPADDVLHCIGCNQGCIGHYHAGTPIALRRQPAHRPRADAAAARGRQLEPRRAGDRRRPGRRRRRHRGGP